MNRTSTRTTITTKPAENVMAPKKKTIMMIRQFARIYMPMGNLPGLVLN